MEHFTSQGKSIGLQTLESGVSPESPSVLVLHGASGIGGSTRLAPMLGEAFSEQGLVVHFLHYFDASQTSYATDQLIHEKAPLWREVVRDAAAEIRQRRPGAPLILAGYSLGGYLAAAEIVRGLQVEAAIILAGGLDPVSAREARQAVPTLILHGSDDRRVPVSEAERLVDTLQRLGGNPEAHFYPGEGHYFSFRTYGDLLGRCLDFIRRHSALPTQV